MALGNLFGWNNKMEAAPAAACGSACGSGDKPAEKPAACGSACGAGDKPGKLLLLAVRLTSPLKSLLRVVLLAALATSNRSDSTLVPGENFPPGTFFKIAR